MADTRIKNLPGIGAYTNVADNDTLVLSDTSDSGDEKQLAVSEMAKKVLGNRSFGGAGNIVTADGSDQTLTGKKLVTPRLNSETPLSIDGAVLNKMATWDGQASDLNKLTGNPATKAQLAHVAGARANLQDQIDALAILPENKRYHYQANIIVAGGAGIVISERDLRTNAGVGGTYRVSHLGIIVNTFVKEGGGVWVGIAPDASPGTVRVSMTTHPMSGQAILDRITIAYGDTSDVLVSIGYNIIPVSGI